MDGFAVVIFFFRITSLRKQSSCALKYMEQPSFVYEVPNPITIFLNFLCVLPCDEYKNVPEPLSLATEGLLMKNNNNNGRSHSLLTVALVGTELMEDLEVP